LQEVAFYYCKQRLPMEQPSTPILSPEKVVNPTDAQPKEDTLLFLRMFARLYVPVTGPDKDALLN